MKTIFKRKKSEQFYPDGFTPCLERAVFMAQIIFLERRLKEAKEAKSAAVTVKDTGVKVIRTTFIAVKKAVTAFPSLALAGLGLILLLVIALFIGVFSAFSSSSLILPGTASLSEEVLAHTETIEKYAEKYEIEDYVAILQAIMMQESGGKGNDPMQASESGFNEKYPRVPNGITDPEYSIEVGVKTFADCIKQAKVKDPLDTESIYLALQGYNYGNGYISWAKENYGGYTYANAVEFSTMMAEQNGWSGYGDTEYVSHVLRYYVFGRIPTGTGSQAIVQVALTQEGNGGDTYWSWYGFTKREEWCACFVSWCADQCGYIEAGVIPKFSLCSAGMEWFESRGQFMDGSYVPTSGDLVFFDWGNDGSVDHVGIVESVVDGTVYTIEGNSGDKVARRSYPIGYAKIVGYGVPAY